MLHKANNGWLLAIRILTATFQPTHSSYIFITNTWSIVSLTKFFSSLSSLFSPPPQHLVCLRSIIIYTYSSGFQSSKTSSTASSSNIVLDMFYSKTCLTVFRCTYTRKKALAYCTKLLCTCDSDNKFYLTRRPQSSLLGFFLQNYYSLALLDFSFKIITLR